MRLFYTKTVLTLGLGLILTQSLLAQQENPEYLVNEVIAAARNFLPYDYGDEGLDCSLLIQKSFEKIGIEVGRTTRDQVKEGEEVYRNRLQRGDLIFFNMKGKIGHVGMVVSFEGEPIRFIHTSASKGVTETLLSDDYWSSRYAVSKRLIGIKTYQVPLSPFLSDFEEKDSIKR